MIRSVKSALTAADHARVFSALSDPLRLRFVQAVIQAGEATGTVVAENLGISLALLCHHARILVDAGVLDKRKEGQTSYYKAQPEVLAETFSALTANPSKAQKAPTAQKARSARARA